MTAQLDRLLGRVTMYTLVIIWLGVILVTALVASILGVLSFTPLELLASVGVLFATSYLVNGLFGVLFRLRPQLSSTAITALLLACIFDPTIDPAGLGILALAAALAVVAKYLLAVRGRHVFNPAAIGAFLVGFVAYFVPSTFASWWVGTGPLLPFVAVGALAILYRTRRLPLGLVAVGVYVVLAGLVVVLQGGSYLGGVQTAVLSSPIVFLAGFMLSEPLTLPPRRRQQLLVAGIVAVAYVVPFSFFAGLLHNSPELALVIGNAVAFAFGQRRGIRLAYVGKRRLSPTSWEFEFEPAAPVRFAPGQYMEFTLPHTRTDARGWRRVFSIASAPGDGSRVRFGIRLPDESSSFKKALLALEPGSIVSATSVSGDFLLPADADKPLLLVAGGIGITPYISHLAALREAGESRDVSVVYAVSSADDIAYVDELTAAGCAVTIVSRDKPASLPKGWTWADTDRLTGDSLLAAVPDAVARDVFLSGPPNLVGSLRTALRSAGARRVHTDVFLGY